jgi:hypothetical protein
MDKNLGLLSVVLRIDKNFINCKKRCTVSSSSWNYILHPCDPLANLGTGVFKDAESENRIYFLWKLNADDLFVSKVYLNLGKIPKFRCVGD